MVRWMAEDGMPSPELEAVDFTRLGYGLMTPEMLEWMVPPLERFIVSKTKRELLEGAVPRRIMLFPVATSADIVVDPQLQARQYFQHLTHPALHTPMTFLGPFARLSATPLTLHRLPPSIGEHNRAIYQDELGLSPAAMAMLREQGVL